MKNGWERMPRERDRETKAKCMSTRHDNLSLKILHVIYSFGTVWSCGLLLDLSPLSPPIVLPVFLRIFRP